MESSAAIMAGLGAFAVWLVIHQAPATVPPPADSSAPPAGKTPFGSGGTPPVDSSDKAPPPPPPGGTNPPPASGNAQTDPIMTPWAIPPAHFSAGTTVAQMRQAIIDLYKRNTQPFAGYYIAAGEDFGPPTGVIHAYFSKEDWILANSMVNAMVNAINGVAA